MTAALRAQPADAGRGARARVAEAECKRYEDHRGGSRACAGQRSLASRRRSSWSATTTRTPGRDALGERAIELGWPAAAVAVVDGDLARAGASIDGRLGLKELVARSGRLVLARHGRRSPRSPIARRSQLQARPIAYFRRLALRASARAASSAAVIACCSLMSRAIVDAAVIAPRSSLIGETVNDTGTRDPSLRTRTDSK